MKVNEFFDKVVVINLDRRIDRLEKITDQLKFLDIKFERFSAIDAKKLDISGQAACATSHYKVIEMAITENLNNILILEDDGIFADDFQEKFDQYINELPEDWDMFYLQGTCICSNEERGGLKKIYHCLCTGALGIKNTMFTKLLEINDQLSHVDHRYSLLHRANNVYAVYPSIIKQGLDYSDIAERLYDPSYIF